MCLYHYMYVQCTQFSYSYFCRWWWWRRCQLCLPSHIMALAFQYNREGKRREKQRLKHMPHHFYCHLSKFRAHYLIRYDSFCDSIEFAHGFGVCSGGRGLEMNNVCILYEFIIYFSGKPFIFITSSKSCSPRVLHVSFLFASLLSQQWLDVHSPHFLCFSTFPQLKLSHNTSNESNWTKLNKTEPIQNIHTWENNGDNYCYLCARRNHNYAFNIF